MDIVAGMLWVCFLTWWFHWQENACPAKWLPKVYFVSRLGAGKRPAHSFSPLFFPIYILLNVDFIAFRLTVRPFCPPQGWWLWFCLWTGRKIITIILSVIIIIFVNGIIIISWLSPLGQCIKTIYDIGIKHRIRIHSNTTFDIFDLTLNQIWHHFNEICDIWYLCYNNRIRINANTTFDIFYIGADQNPTLV